MTDEEIEREIVNRDLTAPRVTAASIAQKIVAVQYHNFPGTTLTICALRLENGYLVTGESAAASPENFDAELGRKLARDAAYSKIWALEGYLLREKLYKKAKLNQS
jgi:hypothetical protein